MAELTPFAQMPATPEPLIAQLRQQLATAYPLAAQREGRELETIATVAIRDLWDSRVKTFVPVLALREARVLAHERGWDDAGSLMPAERLAATTPRSSRAETSPGPRLRDRLHVAGDTFQVPEHDRLRLD